MILKRLYFLLFILFSTLSYCQKEANIWYFGNHAGLDFNSGSPVALTDGELETLEGCASISDKFGNILFYTDGKTVYNKMHGIMPNGTGLKGDNSCTQSAIIVPKPGSDHIYYIFTTARYGMLDGLRYSEVDMTLDGGKGNITATKNELLTPPVNEKVTAVLHSNKKDIWVITNENNSNKFYSFLITSSGISSPAVISAAGKVPTEFSVHGYLKASSDGRYLAQCQWFDGNVDLLKFNSSTGNVTDWINLPHSDVPYGLEFSPNSKLLYISMWQESDIYQFNLALDSPKKITASKTLICKITGAGALQLGPDKKIYTTKYNTSYLACIPNPNKIGVSCGFIENAVDLSGKKSLFGLPNFIQNISTPSVINSNLCSESNTSFLVQDSSSFLSVDWDFGDPTSEGNKSVFFGPKHQYKTIGSYTVQAIVKSIYYPNDTTIDIINIIEKPKFDLGLDTTFCDSINLKLMIPDSYDSYLWSNDTTNYYTVANSANTYWVKATNKCGFDSDTIHVIKLGKPNFYLGNDTTICFEEPLNLSIKPFKSYSWQDGSTNSSFIVNDQGKYWVTVQNKCQSNSDTIKVDIKYCHPIIPNVITTNSDGINDVFSIRGLQLGVADLKILNRWGNLIYESKGYQNDWSPKDINDGVYYYILNYPPENKTYTGFVTVFNGK